ncbi:MAG: 2TM domain-containing protein [Acidimicrobiia bacterium]|nr:2TM domain-containing protein [Acidimicrobiia bacterium]
MKPLVDEQDLRADAVKRIKAKRDFWAHAIVFVFVNALMVWVWSSGGRGHFWPMWMMWGWGMGLAFHAWDTYKPADSEAAIQREIEKGSG